MIAGICGGTYLLASYGILNGKKCTGDLEVLKENGEYIDLFKDLIITKEDVVIDGNIIISTGQAFV